MRRSRRSYPSVSSTPQQRSLVGFGLRNRTPGDHRLAEAERARGRAALGMNSESGGPLGPRRRSRSRDDDTDSEEEFEDHEGGGI